MAKREPRLATIVKQQINDLLRTHHPEHTFSLRRDVWTTGGSVDLTWTDGPSEPAIEKLLKPIKANTDIIIIAERRYSLEFLRRVASEYCMAKKCHVPAIVQREDGTAYLDRMTPDLELIYAIMAECRGFDTKEIARLAYREWAGDGRIERDWIVRKKDHSGGLYEHLAVV